MLEVVEKLLILQDRDRRIERVRLELSRIGPERQMFQGRTAQAQAALDAAKSKARQLETARKALELEVITRQQQIERYSNQQLQTRKNEEYRALAHEIETCKAEIVKIEDREIELMEQTEVADKEAIEAARAVAEATRLMEEQVAALGIREQNLRTELANLEKNREDLAAAVDESARARYERLFRSKGQNVVVGIQHGVCGGCHMRVPAQVLVTCQAQQELVSCTNCGRILYYTRDMDLAIAE